MSNNACPQFLDVMSGVEKHFLTNFERTKSRARKKQLDFDLTQDWLKERYNKGVCQVTGIPFSLETIEDPEANECIIKRPFAPSIDRKDPSKGYTQDNCQLVIWQYNQMKFLWSQKELVKFCRAVLIAEAVRKNAL